LNAERIEALFAAIKAGDRDAALSIVDANPELIDSYSAGVSPIRAAIYNGNLELAMALGDRSPMPTLHDASALGRSWQIAHLDGNVNAFSEDGFTPLTLAAAFGNKETVNALIALGADIELFSINANIKVAPIHAAAFGGNADALASLLALGANPNSVADGGFTALHSAAQNNDKESVVVLLAAGADPTLRSDEGKTPADYATEIDLAAIGASIGVKGAE